MQKILSLTNYQKKILWNYLDNIMADKIKISQKEYREALDKLEKSGRDGFGLLGGTAQIALGSAAGIMGSACWPVLREPRPFWVRRHSPVSWGPPHLPQLP